MKQYLELVSNILENGERKDDRTGTGTLSIFGTQTKYDLRDGFPLLTTKKVLFTGVVRELLYLIAAVDNQTIGLGWDGYPFFVAIDLQSRSLIRGQDGKGSPVGMRTSTEDLEV